MFLNADTDYGSIEVRYPTRDGESPKTLRMHRKELAEHLAKTIELYEDRQRKAKAIGRMPPNWLDGSLESLRRQRIEILTELEDESPGHEATENYTGVPTSAPWLPWLLVGVAVVVIYFYFR